MRPLNGTRSKRRGVAAVELALLLPVLLLFFLIALDFGRVYYGSLTSANCARNGALYEAYTRPVNAPREFSYTSASNAAAADGGNVNIDPTNDVTTTSSSGKVTVTVTHRFRTVTNYFNLPNPMNVNRRIVMREVPLVPSSDLP